MKRAGTQGEHVRKTKADWLWRKRYRIPWDANRKIFLYPENWVQPDLRLATASRASLREVAAFICTECGSETTRTRTRKPASTKTVRVLFLGNSRLTALLAAQILAGELRLDLYRIDLSSVVSKFIEETEKNLGRVFDAAEEGGAILFFDEAAALFGRRTGQDNHDRYVNIRVNDLLQRMEEYNGLSILSFVNCTKIDKAVSQRFKFVISLPPPRKPRRRHSSAC